MSNELATADQVQELQQKLTALQLTEQAAAIEQRLRHHELSSRVVYASDLLEGWGDFVDPLDPVRSEPDFFDGRAMNRPSRPQDRSNGDNAPFFDSETTLASIQGAGEWIGTTDPTAMGALEILSGYVIHDGFTHKAEPKTAEWLPLAQAVQVIIDQFLEDEAWWGDLDDELFQRTRRAGESFLRIVPNRDGTCTSEVCEPSWITEPLNAREIEAHWGLPELDWKYGVASTIGRPTEVWGYYVLQNGDVRRGMFVPASEMIHQKVNVPRNVKRGLSDFYVNGEWLNGAAGLLDRTVKGGKVQSSIALYREWPQGSKPSAVQGAADSVVDFDVQLSPASVGTRRSAYPRTVPAERYFPGKVVDAPHGGKVTPGPMGSSNAPTYIEITEAAMTKACRRWAMDRTLVTGDASADTYASALVAEAPFVRVCQRAQTKTARRDEQVLWCVVDNACRSGRIPYPLAVIKQFVIITAVPPDIAVRDFQAMHTIRKEQNEAGILSDETWSEQEGLDREKELLRGAKRAMKPGFDPETGVPLAPVMPMGQPQALTESVVEPSSRLNALAERAIAALMEGRS